MPCCSEEDFYFAFSLFLQCLSTLTKEGTRGKSETISIAAEKTNELIGARKRVFSSHIRSESSAETVIFFAIWPVFWQALSCGNLCTGSGLNREYENAASRLADKA